MTNIDDKDKLLQEYENKAKKDKRHKIVLIIIIIGLILLWLVTWELGKIGYDTGSTNPTFKPGEQDEEQIHDNDNSKDKSNDSKKDKNQYMKNETENYKIIKVSDKNGEITENTELDIFSNERFNGEKVIAPRSSGEYKFVIENTSDKTIRYDINFEDVMTNPVNMKYRLKMDNFYISGNAKNFVDIEKLNVKDITVIKNSNNVFTLEWYWEDNDSDDTYTGSMKETQYYTLNLMVRAEEYEN